MSAEFDSFGIPSNETLENVKRRVAAWLTSSAGQPYAMRIVSQRHVVITKTKHNYKSCWIPCVYLGAAPLVILATALISEALFFGLWMFYLVSGLVCVIVGVCCFCLQPDKAEYEFRFSEDRLLQVTVLATGSLIVGITDPAYVSLKQAVIGPGMAERANAE